jgi:hypothetical protein
MRVNQFRAAELDGQLKSGRRGFDMSDVAFAPLPEGASPELGEDGAPLRRGRHDGLVNAWLWAVPSSASDPGRSLSVALDLTTPEVQAHFAARNCWVPTVENLDISTSPSEIPSHCRRLIALAETRLSRRLHLTHLPEVSRLTETVSHFERLWGELFVQRGYRGPEECFDSARFREVVSRHLPRQ